MANMLERSKNRKVIVRTLKVYCCVHVECRLFSNETVMQVKSHNFDRIYYHFQDNRSTIYGYHTWCSAQPDVGTLRQMARFQKLYVSPFTYNECFQGEEIHVFKSLSFC